jgi:hypothetical protein
MDQIEELVQLKTLLDKGAITEEEFNILKKKILNKTAEPQKPITNEEMPPPLEKKTPPPIKDIPQTGKINPPEKTEKIETNAPVNTEYELGTELTSNLARMGIVALIALVIVFWVRYDSFIIAIILGGLLFGALYLNGAVTKKVKLRNLYIGLVIILSLLLIFIPIGKMAESSSSAGKTTEAPVDDDAKFVRDFITSHYFEDTENGYTFTLKFSESNGGWFGILQFDMGPCVAQYRYETKGRSISLTWDSSNCPNVRGSSTTAHFNSDNSVSFYYMGEEFRFKPV